MFENLFQHWIFWLVVTALVLVFLRVAEEREFRDRVNGSVNGKKRWIGFDPVWWEKNFTRVTVAVAIAGVVLMVVGCSVEFSAGKKEPVNLGHEKESRYKAEIDSLKDDLELLSKAGRDETEQVRTTLSQALMSCNEKLKTAKATK